MRIKSILYFLTFLAFLSCNSSTEEIVAKPESYKKENRSKKSIGNPNNNQTERVANKVFYKKSDLIGMWWTPHYAVRKIYFYEDDRFKLNDGNDNFLNGSYTFSNKQVVLLFDSNQTKIVFDIGGGNDGYSYTLIGEGENFVKEWAE